MNKETEYLEFAINIANQAGKIMKKYFNNISSDYKIDKTIVTTADLEINEYLIKSVKDTFPNHSVDGEENGFGKSNYVWVCDPIDGTAMYARNIPVAVFSLALVLDGTPIIGVVYDPFNCNLYSAIKGNGAFKNQKQIFVNNYSLSQKESIGHYDMYPAAEFDLFDSIKELNKTTYFVCIGSIIRASMCVAEGNFTVAIFPGTKHKNCDIAAVKVIVEEAGGKVTDIFGNEQRYDEDIKGAIISNSTVHDDVLKILKLKAAI